MIVLEDPIFKEWLGKIRSNNEARCKIVHEICRLNYTIWEESFIRPC